MHMVMLCLGYGFLVLGLLGLVLPILQGVLFLVIGLLILARHAPWARRILDELRRRYPRLDSVIERADGWITRCERRVEGWLQH